MILPLKWDTDWLRFFSLQAVFSSLVCVGHMDFSQALQWPAFRYIPLNCEKLRNRFNMCFFLFFFCAKEKIKKIINLTAIGTKFAVIHGWFAFNKHKQKCMDFLTYFQAITINLERGTAAVAACEKKVQFIWHQRSYSTYTLGCELPMALGCIDHHTSCSSSHSGSTKKKTTRCESLQSHLHKINESSICVRCASTHSESASASAKYGEVSMI